MRVSTSELVVPFSSDNVFEDACAMFKRGNHENIRQMKYMASRSIHQFEEKELPGKSRKWIRKTNQGWVFNKKFLALYILLADEKLQRQMVYTMPEEIRPYNIVSKRSRSVSQKVQVKQQERQDLVIKLEPTKEDKILNIFEDWAMDLVFLIKGLKNQTISLEETLQKGVAQTLIKYKS